MQEKTKLIDEHGLKIKIFKKVKVRVSDEFPEGFQWRSFMAYPNMVEIYSNKGYLTETGYNMEILHQKDVSAMQERTAEQDKRDAFLAAREEKLALLEAAHAAPKKRGRPAKVVEDN